MHMTKSKMADVRHFEKSKNRRILATVQPIATKFGTVMHTPHLNRTDSYSFEFLFKSKIADGRRFENS